MTSQETLQPGGEYDWQEWKAKLRAEGFHPSKRLGQNFLLDDNLLAAIVRERLEAPELRRGANVYM